MSIRGWIKHKGDIFNINRFFKNYFILFKCTFLHTDGAINFIGYIGKFPIWNQHLAINVASLKIVKM